MFAWFQRLLPRQGNFFELFESHAATLVAGANALSRMLQGGEGLADHVQEIIEREHDADAITREVLQTVRRSEEHTSELQSLMRISNAVFCLKKKNYITRAIYYDAHQQKTIKNISHLKTI